LLENEITGHTGEELADINSLKKTADRQGQVTENTKNNNLPINQMKTSTCISHVSHIETPCARMGQCQCQLFSNKLVIAGASKSWWEDEWKRAASSQTSRCGEGVSTSRFLGSHILKKHTTVKRALGRGFVTHGTDRLLRRRVPPGTRHSSLHKNGDLTILNYMYASILRSKRIVQSREYGYINISFRVPVCILM